MQRIARGEKRDHGDGGGARRRAVAKHRKRAERKNDQSGDRRGDGVILSRHRFAPFEKREGRRESESRRGHRHRPERGGHRAPQPAEQADQGKGADAGRAPAVALVAFAPAALQPDQQADRQRKSQPLEEVTRVHTFIPASPLCEL